MKTLATLSLMLVLSLGAFAQPDHPGGPPAGVGKPALTPEQLAAQEVKFLTVLLDLSQSQQDLATNIFVPAEKAKVTLETALDTAEAALTDAVIKGGNIDGAADAVGAAVAAIDKVDAHAEASFRALLSADQKTKYDKFLEGDFVVPGNGKGPGNGNGNGPGGTHGPGVHGHGN